MRKIKEVKNKLFITFLYIIILIIFWSLGIPCLFKYFLNIECPGCGMSRAFLSVLKFDFKTAFLFHPMFWSLPLLYIYFLFDGVVIGKKIDRIILIFIFAGFLFNWIVKIV